MTDPDCPECGYDVSCDLPDLLRKADFTRFECPECGTPLTASVTRIIVVELDEDDE